MFKTTIGRLLLTTSPVDFFGIRSTISSSSDNNGSNSTNPNISRNRNHLARNTWRSNGPIQTRGYCTQNPVPNAQNATLHELHKWAVSVTKCGIAKDFGGTPAEVMQQQEKQKQSDVYGDDACFIATYDDIYVAGVADGVGGWRRHGIDPSQFSSQLMANCAEIVRSGEFEPNRPDLIIATAYNRMKDGPRPIGSSTACVVIVNQRKLYAANLGDSGYLICRKGQIVFRSAEQTHYFNAPYQLTLLPEELEKRRASGFLLDEPDCSELSEHELQEGDLILIASDGLWDNVHEEKIAELLAGAEPTETSLQARCNSLALIARLLSNDDHFESPFTKRAWEHGIRAPGGKPDDVTIVLFYVS